MTPTISRPVRWGACLCSEESMSASFVLTETLRPGPQPVPPFSANGGSAPANGGAVLFSFPEREGHGHRRHHAPDGRIDRRRHHHEVDEEGRRRRQARRADLRDLDRQGGRRNPVARGGHPPRDPGPGGPDRRDQHRRRAHRRGGRGELARARRSEGGLACRRRASRHQPPRPPSGSAEGPTPSLRSCASPKTRRCSTGTGAGAGAGRSEAGGPAPGAAARQRCGLGKQRRVSRGTHPHAVFPARPKDCGRARGGHRRDRGHRHPQPGHEERHPFLHREQPANDPPTAPRRGSRGQSRLRPRPAADSTAQLQPRLRLESPSPRARPSLPQPATRSWR